MVLISADMYEAISCPHLEDSDNQNQMPFLAEILAKKKC